MTFAQTIAELEPADIQRALGCPPSTSNSWKQGRRTPPEWVQKLVLPKLKKMRNAQEKRCCERQIVPSWGVAEATSPYEHNTHPC